MRASVVSDWLAQRLDRGNGQPIYRQLPSPDDLAQPPKLMRVTPSHQYPLGR